jgi:hypothetical protein
MNSREREKGEMTIKRQKVDKILVRTDHFTWKFVYVHSLKRR